MNVSLVICTKNRHELLRQCLKSIAESSYPYSELIIVDQSDNEVSQKETEMLARAVKAMYYQEKKPRLAVSRNRALKLVNESSELVVFADDDFAVDKNWLASLLPNFNDPEVVCCTGRMLPLRNDTPSRLFERTWSFDKGGERRVFTRKHINIFNLLKTAVSAIPSAKHRRLIGKAPPPWVGGGFVSFRKEIFREVGYFDEELGIGTYSAGEDVDMYYRILKAGYVIVYEPTSIVYHNHPGGIEDILRFSYTRGTIRRQFYKKYALDPYMITCFLGSTLLNSLHLMRAILKKDREVRRVLCSELKGFMNSKWAG